MRMTTNRMAIGLLLLALMLAPFAALAQGEADAVCSLVTLVDAWARETPEGAPTGAVFGLLVNLGTDADTLIGAGSDAAEAVELHQTTMEGDVMRMQPVEGGIAVPPGGYVELAPGGLHVMLIGLSAALEAGETLSLTLTFENAGEVEVTVPVKAMDAENGMGGMQTDMGGEPEPMSMSSMDWDEACTGIHVLGAWARPAGPGMPNSAAYGLLLNLTETDDTLVSAAGTGAEAIELHEMTMGAGDVMQMRPIEGGIGVPAGGTALLKPGGLHIMMIGLTGELAAGETISLTLTFETFGEIALDVPIGDPAEAPAMSHNM